MRLTAPHKTKSPVTASAESVHCPAEPQSAWFPVHCTQASVARFAVYPALGMQS